MRTTLSLQRNARRPVRFRHRRRIAGSGRASAAIFWPRWDLKKGDRCALLAPNSIRWVALDLALMAEGIIVVPLVRAAGARRTCRHDEGLHSGAVFVASMKLSQPRFAKSGRTAPRSHSRTSFRCELRQRSLRAPLRHADSDPSRSFTLRARRAKPKGVVLNAGNVNYMLGCTNERLDQLMRLAPEPESVFHYTPFCFAASWILLLTSLSRNSVSRFRPTSRSSPTRLKLAAPELFPECADFSRTRPRENRGIDSETRRMDSRRFSVARSALS